ncbi:MAG: immunoglobulin domain-containing protein, partial [Chitinivibrionales bacterium]
MKNTAGLSDTLTITLTLHAPGAIDTLPPMMKILSPSTDSSSVSSSSYPVKILCTDPSGVASVKCFIGAVSMPVTVADSTYTASVSGLKAGMMTTLAFIAADSSARSNKDTLFVHIKYDSTMADNAPPLISLVSPSKDTVIGADSIVVRVKCTDASGVASVVCSLKTNQTFAATKSTPTDSVYSATVKGLTAGAYSSITVTATDASPAHNAAAATVRIKYDNDKMPPSLRLLSPANTNDSAVVTGNATTVQVVCKDGSGVASVTYSMGAAAPQSMTKSLSADSIWSASVTGLAAGQFSTLNIVATDSSLAANKDTLIVHIKYDTTKADNTPPVITLISPSKDTAIAADSALVSVKCTDASGIATLVYTLGTQSFTATRSAPTDSIFNATVKGLTAGAYSTVTITATDASVAHNTATATVKIKYDNDKTGPTIERFDPAVDSQSVSASSYAVKVVCKDTSGVASVVLGLGTASFPGTKSSDSIWTATVTNLVSGAFNKITVTATDGSVSANVSTLNLSIKYDPTMTDNVPPSITLVGPSKDTIVTVDSFVVRVKCTDASGVASVIYTLGTQTFTATRSAPTDSIFSATVKGLSTAANPTVTITATDASTAANKGTKTVALSFAIAAKITTALASTTAVNTGSSTALTIVATGTPAPLYQWYFNGAVITTNSQSASYSKSWTAADAGTYKVIITNVAGQDSSKTVLSVNVAPVISPKLAATTAVNPGSTTALTIAATGTPAPTYQWYFNGTAITTNGTLASYSKTWASTDAGTYKVIASNSAGKDSSSTVLSVNVAPVISPKLAATTTVVSGSSTALTITATGTPTPTYQWYFNGTAISTNGTSASYSKTWATTDAGTYKVIASNAAGKDSSTTVLSVNVKATITTPLAATSSVASGSSTGLAITATGTPAPTYQWYFNGTAIATNGTSASYSKTWAFTDAGTYKVVATNSAGKDSSTTTLKVLGWERVVLAINDPDGSTPCAVMTSNGDIYMAYNSMALYCDKLAANTTTWVHTSSDPIEVYKGSFGGKFDIELSSDKTVPYVGYVDPPSGGDVVQ